MSDLEPIATRNLSVEQRAALFCDQGPHTGMYRVDLRLSVYLTAEQAHHWAEHGFIVALRPAPAETESDRDVT